MKPLTTSVYTFSNLIEGGFLYVDKTAGILELLRPASAQYFLSRPRRFGKSLLVSTLKSIFQGCFDLFDGLAIAESDYDWRRFPVIDLNLGSCAGESPEHLERSLVFLLDRQAAAHGVALTAPDCASRFHELIDGVAGAGKVVVLVDEYDKPLLGHLGKPSAPDIQAVLKRFYSVIKTTEAHQRFALLTGVSKFSKVSVFSDLNNLTDLTLSRSAATLLGYTQAELETNFPDYIERLAVREGLSVEETLAALRDWYNGYRFARDAERLYNPVSVMKCFQEEEFRNYWFETGTPTFLINLMRDKPIDLEDLAVPETAFSAYEPDRLEPLPLLVQTGYLTIARCSGFAGLRSYELAYPNREIEQSFSYFLARDFAGIGDQELGSALRRMTQALQEGRIDDMLEHLKTFFAGVPNTITLRHEKYYQTIFFTVFKLIGAAVEAETSTNTGRVDAVVKTESQILVFEFKLHGTAEEALAQIREKGYAEPYRDDPRRVTLVGAAFDPDTRNIEQWLVAEA